MTDYHMTAEARASRKELPAELQGDLFELLELLCDDPGLGKLLHGDRATRLYQHDNPPIEITYHFDEEEDIIVFLHFSVTFVRLKRSVFLSYSHQDRSWLRKIREELKPFEVIGAVKIWADTEIKPGEVWASVLEKNLQFANAALLLLSADFLESKFIRDQELPVILAKAEKEVAGRRGFKLLWVLVRRCEWQKDDAGHRIGRFQALLDPAKALEERAAAGDAAFKKIQRKFAEEVRISG